jgi:drug/metabolite transporter (DMT)-like permease
MGTLAFGIVLAKPVLERSDIIWATTVRQLGSLAVLAPFALLMPGRRKRLNLFRPHAAWKFSLPGAILGSYLALILWIGGMKYTSASSAGILNQTSTIHTLVFASLFLKEPFTKRKGLAASLAMLGILLVL